MTGYFQRISKDRLKTVMEMEADRMVNLKLTEKEVATEREVIIEERRSRTENSPSSILSEQMSAALYQNHPYRIPIIGWMHEMAKLSREDALARAASLADKLKHVVVQRLRDCGHNDESDRYLRRARLK